MYYNDTELDSKPALQSYEAKPTWGETVSASFKNFTSVNLSTSEQNYYLDNVKENMKTWIDKAPEHKDVYKRVMIMSSDALANYENLYEKGKIDTIRADKSEIGGLTGGEAFLRFKELEKLHGFNSLGNIKIEANSKAKSDYLTSLETLSKSDYTSAKMLGTMGGVMTDPITLATLPLGTFVSGGSVALNAARAFGQEALIETAAQGIIAPKVYAYKKELEIKTSIMEEATQAVMSVATAGTFRTIGSVTYDLTAKGIAQLKVKDPELAKDYQDLMTNSVTDNLDEHVQNMHKVEFGDGVDTIKNPNEKGLEINESTAIKEAEEFEIKDIIEDEDLTLTIGTDEQGLPIQKSYKELDLEIDTESKQMDDLFNCLKGI